MFAKAANRRPAWNQALQGFNVIQSQQVLEWMAEGETQGKIETKADALLRVLELKFQTVPQEIGTAVRATNDLGQLNRWFDAAVVSATLTDFRQASNL